MRIEDIFSLLTRRSVWGQGQQHQEHHECPHLQRSSSVWKIPLVSTRQQKPAFINCVMLDFAQIISRETPPGSQSPVDLLKSDFRGVCIAFLKFVFKVKSLSCGLNFRILWRKEPIITQEGLNFIFLFVAFNRLGHKTCSSVHKPIKRDEK